MTVLLADENDDFISDQIMQFVQFVHLVNKILKGAVQISQKLAKKLQCYTN
jgi:hypothetical protein